MLSRCGVITCFSSFYPCFGYLSYYFGGDTHTGPKTIVHSMASGKDIAFKIIDNINDLYHIKNN